MNKNIKYLILTLLVAGLALVITYLTQENWFMGMIIAALLVLACWIFNKILKNPFWGFLLLVFFLPFERIPSLDIGMITIKINQILTLMVIIAWILKILFSKEKIVYNPLTWPIIIFLLICFLSIFQAGNIERSIQVFVFVLFMAMVTFLTVNMVNQANRLKMIIRILLFSTLVVCLFAFYQFFGDLLGLGQSLTGLREGYTKAVFGFPRMMAFSNEPLYLANFLFIPLGIMISLFLQKIKFIKFGYLLSLLVLALIVFVLTVSRGAYLGLLAMVLFLLIFKFRKIFTRKNIIIGTVTLCIVGSMVTYFLIKAEPKAYEEFVKHITVEDIVAGESIYGRLGSFQKAIQMWQENPLLGVGIGNYGPYVKNFPDAENVPGWDIVNNEYLEILAETGYLGIITFLIILLVLIWRFFIAFYRCRDEFLKTILLGLMAALLAIMVQYNTFSTLYIMHIWFLIGLIIAVQNLCLKNKLETRPIKS